MEADAIYRLKAKLEELSDELLEVSGHAPVDSRNLEHVRAELAALSDELLERYLDALRKRESAPHGLAKCSTLL